MLKDVSVLKELTELEKKHFIFRRLQFPNSKKKGAGFFYFYRRKRNLPYGYNWKEIY